MNENPEVKIGQVYRDKDKRMSSGNRHIIVMSLNSGPRNDKVLCLSYPSMMRATRHSIKGLQTRFELVKTERVQSGDEQ